MRQHTFAPTHVSSIVAPLEQIFDLPTDDLLPLLPCSEVVQNHLYGADRIQET